MGASLSDHTAIFLQIAQRIEDDIIEGRLKEGEQVPSTNQFAAFYQINPATAAKGINRLVDEGILYKRRGIGMFVTTGAKQELMNKRKTRFYEEFVRPLLHEAHKIGVSVPELLGMIEHRKDEGQS